MLATYAESIQDQEAKLFVYFDNCGGQNKNSTLVKFMLLLAHIGAYSETHNKFFVKGHTKNSCDRGFGHIRKKFERRDCWTTEHVADTVHSAAESSKCSLLEVDDAPFSDYKTLFSKLYTDVKGLKHYQIFSASSNKPGVLECCRSPDSTPDVYDLRKKIDGTFPTVEQVVDMSDNVEALPSPPLNPEKLVQVREKLHPFVPAEFADDALYRAPTAAEASTGAEVLKARTATATSRTQAPSAVPAP